MKVLMIPLLLAAGLCACAHNPRPESPEQRAQKDALFLQEQQNQAAQNERDTAFGNNGYRDDRYSPDYNTTQTEAQPEDQAESNPPERAAAIRSTRAQLRATRARVRSLEPVMPVGGTRGGLLR